MIREFVDSLMPKPKRCSQLFPKASQVGWVSFDRCPGVAVATTPAALGGAHPRALCASCAVGLAQVLEASTIYAAQVEAAGFDPLVLARDLRKLAHGVLS